MSAHVLVARLDSVGDVLLAGPAVRAVAAGGRTGRVTLLCSGIGAPAGRLLPGVDRVLEWDCPWITAGVGVGEEADDLARRTAELARLLAEDPPDEAVILTSFHQSPLPLALELRRAGVPRIVGASVDYAGALLDVRLRPGEDLEEDQPEPIRALRIAEAAGFPLPDGDDGALHIRREGTALPRPDVRSVVALHPGASASARRWPARRFADLVRLLAERGMRCLVTGGPGERELTAEVAGEHGEDLGGTTGLAGLAELFAAADVVVSANTGPAHLAAAVGTPVVSLFSPVVPAVRWAPYGVPTVVLGDQHAPCAGTRATSCPVPGHPCLTDVVPEEAASAVLSLLPAREARTETTNARSVA